MRPCSFLQRVINFVETSEEEFDFITPSREMLILQESKILPKFSIDYHDLDSLKGKSWLNDSVINTYLSIMKYHSNESVGSTNTFFYNKLSRDGPEEASNWEGIKKVPLNVFDHFLIPICAGSHWILIDVNFKEECIDILDPLGGNYRSHYRKINEFLEFQNIPPLPIRYPQVAQQQNGYDCGVFLLQNAFCIFYQKDFRSYSQADIPMIRKRIYKELETTISR